MKRCTVFPRLFSAFAIFLLILIPASHAADLAHQEKSGFLPEINVFDDNQRNGATVIGSKQTLGAGQHLEIQPTLVNGKPLLGIFAEDNAPAGRNLYTVEVTLDEGTLGAVYHGEAVIKATLRLGHDYQVVGRPAKNGDVNVWLIDSRTGKRISRKTRVQECKTPTFASKCL